MPSSLGCRVSHSSVVTVQTIAFIKINNEYSLLVLYIGKNTFIRRHVGRRPSWSTCHAQNYPGPPRSQRRPNLSRCKLVGRRNHHDFVEFRFFKKTYCTCNTATTWKDWTALYHVISLKPTRPNQPAQDLYSLRFKVSSTKLSHLFWNGGSTSLYCYDFVFSKKYVSVLLL